MSQMPDDARHVTVAATNVSLGQFTPVPVQSSAMSQMPDDARHVTVAAMKVSLGQAAAEPVQVS